MAGDDGLVARLAAALARRGGRWPWWLPPVLTGLLVFSTLWGFGRAAFPDVAGWFLLAGIAVGLAATTVIARGRR